MSAAAKEKTPVAGEQGGVFGCGTRHTNHIVNHDENQVFETLRAKFAQAGHTFSRTENLDGTIYYLASRWGLFRDLKGLEAAAAFLAVIGGL